MNESKFMTWVLGFCVGILFTIGADRLMHEEPRLPDAETARANELINIYKRGVKDALKTNPVSFELEQTCLEVWANKQPADMMK